MLQGQVFLKGEQTLSLFKFFKVFSFLHLEITLCKIKLCIWRKITFFCHDNFMKKINSNLSKNEPENIR